MGVEKVTTTGTAAANSGRRTGGAEDGGFSDVLSSSMAQGGDDLDRIFQAAAKKYDVPVKLLKAVAKTESNFNSRSTSGCGAMGIMQLMPATAKSLGVCDAYDPQQNIMGGAKYLSQLLREFGGNTELAVAAYNAGSGNVRKYNGIPPFAETRNYVGKVLGYCGGEVQVPVSAASAATENVQSGALRTARDYYADTLAQMALMNIYRVRTEDVWEDGDGAVT